MGKVRKYDMAKISEDIVNTTFDPGTTLKQVVDTFYGIMKKYGIKKYSKIKGGFQGDNFEWTICQTMFFETFVSGLELRTMLCNHKGGEYELPEDLKY